MGQKSRPLFLAKFSNIFDFLFSNWAILSIVYKERKKRKKILLPLYRLTKPRLRNFRQNFRKFQKWDFFSVFRPLIQFKSFYSTVNGQKWLLLLCSNIGPHWSTITSPKQAKNGQKWDVLDLLHKFNSIVNRQKQFLLWHVNIGHKWPNIGQPLRHLLDT